MPKAIVGAIAAGVMSGLMITLLNVAALAGGVLIFLTVGLNFVALVPTFAVGLSHGVGTALYGIGAAAVTVSLLSGIEFASLYLVAFGVPQAWLIYLALQQVPGANGPQWYPAGRLVAWLIALALGYLLVLVIMYSGEPGGFRGVVEREFVFVVESVSKLQGIKLNPDETARTARTASGFMPVVMALVWVLTMLVNGVLGQRTAARRGRALRPSPSFADLALPDALTYCFGALLLLSFLPGDSGPWFRTAAHVVAIAYLLLGLAVIHAFARASNAGRPFLVTTYALLVLFQLWLSIALVLLGLAEQVFGLRRRFNKARGGQEEE